MNIYDISSDISYISIFLLIFYTLKTFYHKKYDHYGIRIYLHQKFEKNINSKFNQFEDITF